MLVAFDDHWISTTELQPGNIEFLAAMTYSIPRDQAPKRGYWTLGMLDPGFTAQQKF